MLGAQALRAKQKAEQKKKKKLSNAELQCERIQKAAREDEAKFLEKVAHLHLEDARTLSEIAEETRRIKQGRHHSVQEPPSIRLATIGEFDHPRAKLSMLSKSSSTDFTKVGKNNKNRMDFVDAEEGVSGKRFLRWLGLSTSSSAGSSRQSSKKPPKRRMSTFS